MKSVTEQRKIHTGSNLNLDIFTHHITRVSLTLHTYFITSNTQAGVYTSNGLKPRATKKGIWASRPYSDWPSCCTDHLYFQINFMKFQTFEHSLCLLQSLGNMHINAENVPSVSFRITYILNVGSAQPNCSLLVHLANNY